MDIGSLIHNMTIFGYIYHTGFYTKLGGYSFLFNKNNDYDDKSGIAFYKIIDKRSVYFGICIYDKEGKSKEYDSLTTENFHQLFCQLMSAVHDKINLADINLELPEN